MEQPSTEPNPSLTEFPRTPEFQGPPPDSENAFIVWSAKTDRHHLIGPFKDYLQRKIQNREFQNRDEVMNDSISLFQTISENLPLVSEIRDQLNQLGLNNHLVITGEHGHLLKAILQANKFGTSAAKIQVLSKDSETILPANRPHIDIDDANHSQITIPKHMTQLNTDLLAQNVDALARIPQLIELTAKYSQDKEAKKILAWAADQAIIRSLLPREPLLSQKTIDLSTLQKVKDLGNGGSTSENFQASNPSWICQDPETGRKYIAKKCPPQTLQADAFGLKVLEMHGVPTYEYYLTTDPADGRQVLVSGFLEGYKDPADVLSFPLSVTASERKTILPPELVHSRAMQRPILAEILIGEYNSKAHNFMIDADDHNTFVHFDQGGSLTSTASGKFKSFHPNLTIQDIDDVLSCYSDWDADKKQQTNPAYAQIAEVKNNELVIHDPRFAREILHQEQNIPIEWYHKALESTGFTNGPESIQRLNQWIEDIDAVFLPKYTQMPDSKRKEQYIRWANGAKENFRTAIQLGGELNFYKFALQKRRERLLTIWENAIKTAENRPQMPKVIYGGENSQGWETLSPNETKQIKKKWWAAWDTVIDHNNNRSNLHASVTLFVESVLNPHLTSNLPNNDLSTGIEKEIPRLSPERKVNLVTRLIKGLRLLEAPLSSKNSLTTLESITKLGDTSIWTTGNMTDSADHNLPNSLFESTPLPGSREQLFKLRSSGVLDLRRRIGKEKLKIEAHNDKLAELPRLAETAIQNGKEEIVIIDDSIDNLEEATKILAKYPTLAARLILVNQGRKRTPTPPLITPSASNHNYYTVDNFDQIPTLINQWNSDIQKREILCDFDGVVTDNTAVRARQEDYVCHALSVELSRPPNRNWQSIQELRREDFSYKNVLPQIEEARRLGYKVVLTNGVFDILHPGHVDYLDQAKQSGGNKVFLVVGINSDKSAKEQGKGGPERPIVGEEDRARTILGLESTNAVIIFDDQTADALIDTIKPDIYVKGGDYTMETEPHQDVSTGKIVRPLPERSTILKNGVTVKFVSLRGGQSSSKIINTILSHKQTP